MGPNLMATVIPSNRLHWRSIPEGTHTLHLDRRAAAIVSVVPDQAYSGMWRVRLPDGSLTDMVNLTRAKDAALHHALTALNRKPEAKEPVQERPYSDLNVPEGVRYPPPSAGLTQGSSAAHC